MFPRVFLALLVACAVSIGPGGGSVLGWSAAEAQADSGSPGGGRPVVLVLVPELFWGNAPPALDGYARASLSVRTAHAHGTADDGYLSVGKGAPSSAPGGLGVGPVAQLSQGPSGPTERGAQGFTLAAWDDLRGHDATLHQPGELGTLGQTLVDWGQPWALVTSDPAATAAAVDRQGVVRRGVLAGAPGVSQALSEGVRTLIVGTSVRELPSVLAAAGSACVVVASVSTPDGGRHLGVLATSAACGLGTAGLESASIRQDRLATLRDIAPTYLAVLGAPRPPAVTGTAVTPTSGASRATLEDRDQRTFAADRVRSPLVWLLVGLSAVGAAVSLAWRRARVSVAYGLLAVPAASFLIMLFPWWRWGMAGAVLTGALLCSALALGAAVLGRTDVRLGVGGLALVAAAVLTVDAAFGGVLEVDAPFGNSPVIGARFFGVGNIGSGFLAAGMLVAGGLALERWGSRAFPAVALAFGAALLVGAGPWFGADVGGVLAYTPAYALLLVSWRDGRPSLRRLLLALATTVAVLGLFSVLDLMRPGSSRSHLGGALASGGELWDEMVRKGQRALGTIKSPMALLIPIGAIALAVARPRQASAAGSGNTASAAGSGNTASAAGSGYTAGRPALRATAMALLVAGVAGSFLNDSGLVVGAAVMAVAWPAFMAVATGRRSQPGSPPADDAVPPAVEVGSVAGVAAP